MHVIMHVVAFGVWQLHLTLNVPSAVNQEARALHDLSFGLDCLCTGRLFRRYTDCPPKRSSPGLLNLAGVFNSFWSHCL